MPTAQAIPDQRAATLVETKQAPHAVNAGTSRRRSTTGGSSDHLEAGHGHAGDARPGPVLTSTDD